MQRMFLPRRTHLFFCLSAAALFLWVPQVLAQPKAKLRRLESHCQSNTIAATHFYVGRSLGIFESHGFDRRTTP